MPSFFTVLVAAGNSTRFQTRAHGSPVRKQFELVNNRPMFTLSAEIFLRQPDCAGLVLVLPEDSEKQWPQFKSLLASDKPVLTVAGGALRGESVQNGLRVLPAGVEWVAVHDAARPNISPELIQRVWSAAQKYGAAIPSLPITDTVKLIVEETAQGHTLKTLDRKQLVTVQTPQISRLDWLKEAYNRPIEPQDTDDASMLEKAGHAIQLVPGDLENIKITTHDDWQVFQAKRS